MGALAAAVRLLVAPGMAAGQGATPGARRTPLRTAWGDPDLQGVWTATTPTPLEQPLAGARVIQTDEEAVQLERELARNYEVNRGGGNDPNNLTGSYNAFWQN